jgi:hypothetical protein
MTCQECEIKLGNGENADEHLGSCAECRWLAEELRLNAQALRDMREMRERPAMRWEWALAAAAAIIMAVFVSRTPRVEKLPVMAGHGPAPQVQANEPQVAPSHIVRVKRIRKKQEPTVPLRVKMFTSDPDVVIYWIVDRKEGSE